MHIDVCPYRLHGHSFVSIQRCLHYLGTYSSRSFPLDRSHLCVCACALRVDTYGVATISRLLEIIDPFVKEPYKRDNILRKSPLILSILLTVATPYTKSISGSSDSSLPQRRRRSGRGRVGARVLHARDSSSSCRSYQCTRHWQCFQRRYHDDAVFQGLPASKYFPLVCDPINQ